MLHFVEATDGEPARRRHLVDFGFGVVTVGLQQFHRPFHGLQHDVFGYVGLETQFHSALRGRTDIAHGVGDAATCQHRSGPKVLLVGEVSLAHVVEHFLYLPHLLGVGTARHDESHAVPDRNGDVGNHLEERRTVAVFLLQPRKELFRGDGGRHVDDDLPRVEHGFDVVDDLFHQPRLHHDGHNVGIAHGSFVVGGDACAHFGEAFELRGVRIGHGDVGRFEPVAF